MKTYYPNRTALAATAGFLITLLFPATNLPAPPEISHRRFDGPPLKANLAKLWETGSVAITFPTAMVPLNRVSAGELAIEQPCPITLDPPIDVHWKWVSQTEGELRPPIDYTPNGTGVLVRRIMYRAKLRKDLRDLEGKPVDPQNWGAQFADDSFALTGVEFLNVVRKSEYGDQSAEQPATESEESGEEPAKGEADTEEGTEEGEEAPRHPVIDKRRLGETLPARPRVRLEFSRDVKLEDVAKAVLFEDSVTHERFPVEVNLEGVQKDSPQGWVIVEPIKPLPPLHTYLLVVERLADPAGEKLPRQQVLPAGKTFPITIKVVAGYNQPVKGAFIRIQANKPFDSESATSQSIILDPPVVKLKIDRDVRNGRTIELLGDFDTTKVYKVTLKTSLKSVDQFPLEKDSVWTARFPKKRPAVIASESAYLFQRASSPSVVCSFVQVNTGKLDWKLATLQPNELLQAAGRLREFGEFVKDAKGKIVTDQEKGEHLRQPTELLIPALGLSVIASGTFDASESDGEMARKIDWKPGDNKPGLYLLEISGKDSTGRTVGNRSIISRGDWVITMLRTPGDYIIRVAGMSDGKPVQGVPVNVLAKAGGFSEAVTTNEYGEARFDPHLVANDDNPETMILAGAPGHQCLQMAKEPRIPFSSGLSTGQTEAQTLGTIVLDRNLYRPGETVKFKGFMRKSSGEKLSVPAGESVTWTITSDGSAIHASKAVVSPSGGWEGEYQIPGSALGRYQIEGGGTTEEFGVAEFRPLPFTIATETSPATGDTAQVKVTSSHFHGAPNAGAKVRWTAGWLADSVERGDFDEEGRPSQFVLDDQHSPDSPARGLSTEILSRIAKAGWDVTHNTGQTQEVGTSESDHGEITLDANGAATIVSKSPFRPGLHRRAHVTWTLDVISASAQTVRGGDTTPVQFVPKILGVKLEPAPGKTNTLALTVNSLDIADKPADGLAAKAEIFRVTVNTVKERLAPNLNRYRNFPEFKKIWESAVTTPAEIAIPVEKAGNYVVRVTAPSQPNTPQVSASTMIDGYEEVPVPVESETGLTVKAERERYRSGDTATIAIEAPFKGMASVIVATDKILSHQVVEIKGNAQRISIPVLPAFSPSAHVCVHLIKAAGADGIPAERFGTCEIHVDRADRLLDVSANLKSEVVEPGADVSGTVQVKSNGRPVSGADVLLYAVDDAILTLGKWKLPVLTGTFFHDRTLGVTTSTTLGQYTVADESGTLSQSQKGFVLGASGLLKGGPVLPFRKFFKPLAFWQPSGRTNAAGELAFQFQAPEALTRYRVVAVVQNSAEQFGSSANSFRIAKSLQVEPALPEFLRLGDEVVLRAVVRQDFAPTDEIDVKVERLGSAIELTEPAVKRITVKKGQPVVVGFRAKAVAVADHARVLLSTTSATQPKMHDAEDNTLRMYPAEIERRETVAGSIAQAKPLDLAAARPPRWQTAVGSCDVFVSGSPYLAKLAGLLTMFEAEGSIEKLSTRVLAATLLADTVKFLPLSADAEKRLHTSIEDGLRQFDDSTLVGTTFRQPCWPGSDKPDDFVTVQTAWALLNAANQGFLVNPELKQNAEQTLGNIVSRRREFEKTPPAIRSFALMVLGQTRTVKAGEAEAADPEITAEAEGLFSERAKMSDEGSAWLALGLHYFRILPRERAILLAEISRPVQASDFDPVTFGTKTRREAIRLFAQCEIASTNWSAAKRKSVRDAFEKITESSVDPSTQENLWLLVLFNSLTRGDISPEIAKRPLTPKPLAVSKNQVSVGWPGVQLAKFAETFPKPLQPNVRASYLLRASYSVPVAELPPRDAGFALERNWQNLTEPHRTGTAEAPWQLGDQVLITYKLNAEKPHSYIEVEDQLPACMETVNPKLPLIAEYFRLPIEAGVNTLPLSNVEQRVERTKLYFEKTLPGRNVYSVLGRVTTAGVFHWPPTQVRPMYDSRFFGASESTIIHAVEGK